MTKVRSLRHRPTHYLTTDDGDEVEVQFAPIDSLDIHVERVGNKLVVAYLAQDHAPSNPMTDFDGQGTLYTRGERVITDDSDEVYSNLCIGRYGEVEGHHVCTINGHRATLAEHAADEFMKMHGGYNLAIEWCDETGYDHDVEDEDLATRLFDLIYGDLVSGDFESDKIYNLIVRLFMENWREIVGPYVVPVSYCASNHGPGTTSVSVTDWDGDPDEPPNGVWVADECCIGNIGKGLPRGYKVEFDHHERWGGLYSFALKNKAVILKHGMVIAVMSSLREAHEVVRDLGPLDVAWAAEMYAEGVLKEYQDWCNGNVYGCVVETFEKGDDDDWGLISDDSCWGFIGSDYAEQTLLDEYFKPAVKAAQAD